MGVLRTILIGSLATVDKVPRRRPKTFDIMAFTDLKAFMNLLN